MGKGKIEEGRCRERGISVAWTNIMDGNGIRRNEESS
jgi:hypothetical protein